MSKQAQAQAQELALAQAKAELKKMSALDLMLSAVPELEDEDGNALPVNVGEKAIEDATLRKVTVSARTIQAFSRVSNIALSIELGQVTKELAKKEGFSSVKRFCALALPDLSDSRIMELYTVGRLFGNPETHKWKAPIPEKATITNLSQVAKALCNTKKLDEATPEDIHERFASFVRDYIDTGIIDLEDTLPDLRQAIKVAKGEVIPTTAQELSEGEGTGEGEGEANTEVKPEVIGTGSDEARKALDTLFTYFKGNDKALEYLALVLAEIPEAQDEAQDEA